MDKIEVTQADREAAAAVLHDNLGWYRAAPVRAGEMDNDSVVQAFAAHRTNRTDATPVAWQRRRMWSYSFDPAGKVHLWEPCSAKEATGHFEKEAGYEYRALYTHPPATDVAALVEQRCPSCGVKFREIAGIAVMAAATSFRASQIESLAHRKAEDG